MIQRIKWTDRKFDFSQPVGLFPMTLERLRGTPVRLYYFTGGLPRDLLTKKLAGAWSIQEHVGHLWNLEELHEGRIDDFIDGAEILRAADMQNKKTYEARHNDNDIKTLLQNFHNARKQYVERLEALDESILTRSALHPRLKVPMRLVDMALFAAEHDDQHLATIRELMR